jgi:hypothetical protein
VASIDRDARVVHLDATKDEVKACPSVEETAEQPAS